jgi:hypothetical protein
MDAMPQPPSYNRSSNLTEYATANAGAYGMDQFSQATLDALRRLGLSEPDYEG